MSTAAEHALKKLADDGAGEAALAAFERRLAQLEEGPEAGMLPGEELEPLDEVPVLDDLEGGEDVAAPADRIVVLKLNGGLGTSMGLRGPKSLIEVKPGRTFLDVIATQVAHARETLQARLPLVLMNSETTRGPSLEALGGGEGQDVDPDFLQGRAPKLRADTHEPVEWPDDPALEWNPPGHGDLYVALKSSGMLDRLRGAGYDWAFVSNADNLGAVVDPRVAAFAEREHAPFVMEVVRGTQADRKGGHLARHDGRIVLRETAQVPDGDDSFTDVDRWRFYNTNNLWIDLRALDELLDRQPAGPDLPLIVNRKTVDPRDPDSPAVLQLETAMGAAIGALDGARAVEVPRRRFAPVKTTDDLLVVRSDAYELTEAGEMRPAFSGDGPVVTLSKHFKTVDALEERFPSGPPSLKDCKTLTVDGDVFFA
jgi:UTP--glucose-1-phosphate uridylyltransferase